MKKKAIIFDCDNTLWDGVLGEGEIITKDIQKDAIFLANRGVIIGLCSKNNEADVIEALKTQPLTMDYISIARINWENKVHNLREIALELNIGLDAIVFVDDSDFEINLIKSALPEVMAIYPDDLMNVANEYFDLSGSFTKTQQYKENFIRARYSKDFDSIDDYLNSLDMTLKIEVNNFDHVERVAELTQKTNQFNLTGYRYTTNEIKTLMDDNLVYSLSVKDKFGDNGLTGICIIRRIYEDYVIDVLLLSCRVLGRQIEYAFMDYIINDLKGMGIERVVGNYKESYKNEQVKDFYRDCGFNRMAAKDWYSINTSDYKPKSKIHFNYE